MAAQITALGNMLGADLLVWGYAAIGLVMVASVVLWVKRLLGV